MDCERKIPLHLLSGEEAWRLFQKHAGINLVDDVALEVAKKCKGLPIAIVAVGTTLKGKSAEEWKEALRKMRNSNPIDVDAGVRDVFTCLQLSYDYLKSNEAKSIFLICSMFPEDHEIFIDDLFQIVVGLGISRKMDSLESARNLVHAGISNLLDSCLLMKSDKRKDHLKMHDLVRDVAKWIASKENRTIMVYVAKGFNEFLDEEAVKTCYALTSWCNEADHIPHQLDAPMLEILLLKYRESLELPNTFFENMKALKVMAMKIEYCQRPYMSIPHSVQFLTNLQTLRLEGWDLGDLSWVVNLKSLQILGLKGSSFNQLPSGLKELNMLKHLDLSWCVIRGQCYEVIGCCSQLEELYCFGNKVIDDMNLAPREYFPYTVAFPNLHRFFLTIGAFSSVKSAVPRNLRTRTLHVGGFLNSASISFIHDLLKRAEDIYFYECCLGCKTFVPDTVHLAGGMNKLTNLRLDSCKGFECIIDTSSHHANLFQAEALLPCLVKIKLKNVYNLKEVCHGPPILTYFEKLEELEIKWCTKLWRICPGQWAFSYLKVLIIDCCPELTYLFPMSVAQTMLVLQELTIKGCRALKKIIINEGADDGTGIGTRVEIYPSPDNSHVMFPQLKELSIISCPKLQHLFPVSCMEGLLQLEEVSIVAATDLKYVFGQHDNENKEVMIELPCLKLLKLQGLTNLLSIFPENYRPSCPSLRKLYWDNCPKFSTHFSNIMVGSDLRPLCDPNLGNRLCSEGQTLSAFLNLEKLEIKNCSVQDILFQLQGDVITNTYQQKKLMSCLNYLKLKNLPELKFIWTGLARTLNLQNLRYFSVSGCNGLKTIFSEAIIRSLQQLEKLSITFCNDLEEIISDSEVQEKHQTSLNSPHQGVCFPNLKELKVMGCNKLKWLFSVALARDDLPQLRYLSVSGLAQLHQVFGGEVGIDWQDNDVEDIILRNLSHLTLKEVPNLIELCPSFKLHNIVQTSTTLHENCPHHRTEVTKTNGSNEVSYEVPSLLAAALNVNELYVENSGAVNLLYLPGVGRAGEPIASKLVRLEVNQCRKLKSVFSMVVCRMLPELTHLMIYDCEELEEIVSVNEEPQNQSSGQGGFPKLIELKVERCNKLKSLFSTAMARMLPKLKLLFISEAAQLVEVFRHIDEDITGEEIVLPNLEELKLKNLPSLVDVCRRFKLHTAKLCEVVISECPKFIPIFGTNPLHRRTEMVRTYGSQSKKEFATLLPAVLNVKDLNIQNCEAVNIFHLEGAGLVEDCSEPIVFKSERIRLDNLLELSFIWTGPAQVCRLLNLQNLEVYQCPKLKSVFSVAIHKSLPQLTSLNIFDCKELEEIITENNESTNLSIAQIYFPKLETLKVERCNKLRSLVSAAMTRMLPQLQRLYVSEAENLEVVFGNKRKANIDDDKEIVLHNLRSIYLNKLPSLLDVCKGFKVNAAKLEKIDIYECPKFSSIMGATQRFSIQEKTDGEPVLMNGSQLFDDVPSLSRTILNVQFLKFKKCGAVNLVNLQGVDIGDDPQQPVALNLRMMKLENVPELKFICTGSNATRIWSFQYLKELEVNQCAKLKCIFPAVIRLPELWRLVISECEELEEIIAELEEPRDLSDMQVCCPKLMTLRIKRCNKLKRLFCPLMVEMFPKLCSIQISEAAQLECVFAHKSKGNTTSPQEIVLPNLWNIGLNNLPSFIDICTGIKLHAEHLWEIKINGCPKVVSMMGASREIPLQRQTEGQCSLEMDGSQPCNEVPLSTLLPEAATTKLVSVSNKNSGVISLFDLQRVGHLRTLEVSQCGKLKSIFSTVVHCTLPKLKYLTISDCDELEEVFSEIGDAGHLPDTQVCFAKLEKIEVMRCNKLRSLLPVSVAKIIPQLDTLHISEAAQLVEIFGHHSEEGGINREGVVLPKLRTIELTKLPCLVDVCKGFELHAESLQEVLVNDCPNFPPILQVKPLQLKAETINSMGSSGSSSSSSY